MVATLVFVLAFVTVGLGTVLVAMRSGPGASKRSQATSSRSARRATVVLLPIVLVVIGVGVPALVLARNGHHHSEVGPGGLALNGSEVTGRESFATHCATCHTLHAANAVGKVGPNLDLLVGTLNESPSAKVGYVRGAIRSGFAGQGQMPPRLVVGQEASDVAQFVAAVAGH
jgi:hypothetical protein